jgi:hypothetical protein
MPISEASIDSIGFPPTERANLFIQVSAGVPKSRPLSAFGRDEMTKKARSALPLNSGWVILSIAAILATVLLAARTPANAAYTFTRICLPGAFFTPAEDINGAGQIVGFNSSTGTHGFLDTGRSFTQIDVPSATGGTVPTGINDSGQIVGWF